MKYKYSINNPLLSICICISLLSVSCTKEKVANALGVTPFSSTIDPLGQQLHKDLGTSGLGSSSLKRELSISPDDAATAIILYTGTKKYTLSSGRVMGSISLTKKYCDNPTSKLLLNACVVAAINKQRSDKAATATQEICILYSYDTKKRLVVDCRK